MVAVSYTIGAWLILAVSLRLIATRLVLLFTLPQTLFLFREFLKIVFICASAKTQTKKQINWIQIFNPYAPYVLLRTLADMFATKKLK